LVLLNINAGQRCFKDAPEGLLRQFGLWPRLQWKAYSARDEAPGLATKSPTALQMICVKQESPQRRHAKN
jgi:hypothetical protein